MRRRISWPISAPLPNNRRAPLTSRNASSRLMPSTSGVKLRKISWKRFEYSAYLSKFPWTNTACGHNRFARTDGIAECTPNERAS